MIQNTPSPGAKARRGCLKSLIMVLLIVLVSLVLALCINALILTKQTRSAQITVTGARLIHTSRGTLQVLDQGNRADPPLVLIHGFASSLHWWDKLAPLLTPHYRVIRMDLLGSGGSESPPSGNYTVEDQATALGEMLQRLGVTRATVIGHSLGGAVAVALAEQRPAEVARLVILDTSVHAANASLGKIANLSMQPLIGPALKLLLDLEPASSATHAEAVAFAPGFSTALGFENPLEPGLDLQEMTDTAYVETQHAFDQFTTAEPLETRLKALRKPLLVIFGAKDQIAVGAANDLYEYHKVPGAQVIVLPGVGHSPQVEAPARTAELIVAFLNNRP